LTLLGLEIVADLLMTAVFPEDKVTAHIERRVAQLRSRLDAPRTKASDVFNELVFRGHPLHRPAIGYEATVKDLTRESLVEFYRRYYAPNNAMLAIVGDFNAGELKRQVADLFGQWQRVELQLPKVPRLTRQSEESLKYVTAPKEQVNIYMGHLGIERKSPDYYALLVMDTILGSSPGFTSRIPRVLRMSRFLINLQQHHLQRRAVPSRRYIGIPDNLSDAAGLRGRSSDVKSL
jgi:zinc protease